MDNKELDKSRAEFEAWHRSKFATKHMTGQPTRDMHNGIYAENYGPENQQQMWEAWQAARAGLAAPTGQHDCQKGAPCNLTAPCGECPYAAPTLDPEMTADELAEAGAAPTGQQAEPVAWIRFRSDGGYEGPIMDFAIEEVRKQSGAWTPLYAAMSTAPAQPKDTTDTNAYRAKKCWPRADAATVKDTTKGQV